MRRLGAVFAAICGLAGCVNSGVPFEAQWAIDHPPPPEKRSIAAMQREVEELFRREGYEIVARRPALPMPHLGFTDFTFRLRKEGKEYSGTAECIVEKPCGIMKEKTPSAP